MVRAEARSVTPPDRHYFFGYYEKSPWNETEEWLLAHGVDFDARSPGATDSADICLIDNETGSTTCLGTTTAWNFQQGAMLQWLGPEYESRVVYNDRERGSFVARVLDLTSGECRTLSRPIYAITPDGDRSVTINFRRLHQTRPGYGYRPSNSEQDVDPAPADDGLFALHIDENSDRLLVSLADLAALDPRESMVGATHWINHPQISPDGERVGFLHRWHDPSGERCHRLYVLNLSSGNLSCLVDGLASHYDWRSPRELVAWTREETTGTAFHRYDLVNGDVSVVLPELIDEDGHNSFAPDDERWMVCDTYADEARRRSLFLYDLKETTRIDLGSFHSPAVPKRPLRCDLHPRWNRDGTMICIDSTHEGHRGMYVFDVSDITSRSRSRSGQGNS